MLSVVNVDDGDGASAGDGDADDADDGGGRDGNGDGDGKGPPSGWPVSSPEASSIRPPTPWASLAVAKLCLPLRPWQDWQQDFLPPSPLPSSPQPLLPPLLP